MPTHTITTYLRTYARTSGDMFIALPLFYPPSWWPLVADCLLHTICLDSHQTDFLLTAAKREHCHYWICRRTVCLYTHKWFVTCIIHCVTYYFILPENFLLCKFFNDRSFQTLLHRSWPLGCWAAEGSPHWGHSLSSGSIKWRHHMQREHHDKMFRSQSKLKYVRTYVM